MAVLAPSAHGATSAPETLSPAPAAEAGVSAGAAGDENAAPDEADSASDEAEESAAVTPTPTPAPPAPSAATSSGDQSTSDTAPSSTSSDASTPSASPLSEPSAQQRSVMRSAAALVCTPGNVYGVTGAGQLRHVDPNGTVRSVGSAAAGVSSFNGLAVGASGSTVYGYERTSGVASGTTTVVSVASLWRYDVATGGWTRLNRTVDSNANSRTVQFIGGAVSFDNNRYYFGGFSQDGTRFRLWEYDPNTNATSFKGAVNTSQGASTGSNGDIAFDRMGNLFIVRGVGATTSIFTVTAANLAAAAGGTIPAALSNSVTTMSNVNGVTFDGAGRVYLGAGNELRSYAMPNFTDRRDVTMSLGGSTDLAGCSPPPTVTLEKVVDGDRVLASDQFRLTLRQGSEAIGQATTTGSSAGVQDERVGPLPTVRGATLQFAEEASGTTNLSDYASSYRCTVDGTVIPGASGQGRSGSVTIPASGEAVVCQIFNAPLVADIAVRKTVVDYAGNNPQPGAGWTLGAAAAATSGSVVTSPTAARQDAGSDGSASWAWRFGSADARATLSVSETQEAGYEFVRGTCVVTTLAGSTRTVDLPDESAVPVTGIAPGDSVDCEYVNKVAGAELTLEKNLQTQFDPDAGVAQWILSASGPTTGLAGVTGESAVTAVEVEPGSYDLSERLAPQFADKADGYQAVSLVCTEESAGAMPTVTLEAATVHLEPGDVVTCTFTNRDLPGDLQWVKVAADSGDSLNGSEWLLTGPSFPQGETVTGGHDGSFSVGELAWGEYELVETKAPTGYQRSDAVHQVTISPAGLSVPLGEIENRPQDPLVLPLTGGTGTTAYWAGGGLLAVTAFVIAVWRVRREDATLSRR
ncbi:hypothetical protein IW252_001668 [Zhihengliuella flava]|uniref:LPXTG cell wall anchor domain-containing protein n=1 Tax=Zhihengliuella flava TaxID=1285193 RepID=A0A931DCA0_9MICC|nr:hypothetical protein [Zhihengliuella flava]